MVIPQNLYVCSKPLNFNMNLTILVKSFVGTQKLLHNAIHHKIHVHNLNYTMNSAHHYLQKLFSMLDTY